MGSYAATRRRQNGEGSAFTGVLLILLLTGGLIYILLATSVGTWLAQALFPSRPDTDVITPEPTLNPENTDAPQHETKTISFSALDAYALQMGVYSNAETANGLITSLKSLGAAGYEFNDGNNVRVFASAYNTEAAAKSVCDRLSNQGYECLVYLLHGDEIEIKITAEAENIEAVSAAVSFAHEIIVDLFDEVIGFDAEERSVDYGRAIGNEMLANVKTIRSSLEQISDEGDVIELLDDYYMRLEGMLTTFASVDTVNRVEMSGKLKYMQIDAIANYLSLLSSIQGL